MMTRSQVSERVDELLAAWNARDLDAFVTQLAPDIYWHDLGMPHPPAIGRPAVRAFSESVLRAFPDFRYGLRGPICVAEDGSSCAVPFVITATQSAPLTPPGFAPTYRPLRIEGLDYLQFDETYVTRIETRFDLLHALEQLLGLSLRPAPGSFRERIAVRIQRAVARVRRRRPVAIAARRLTRPGSSSS
jgi:hypothetical protein